MYVTRKLLKSALRPWIRRQARQQLKQLSGTGISAARGISAAIEAVLSDEFSNDERSWVNRIETLRTGLLQNVTPLSTINNGNHSIADARTFEQLGTGTAHTGTVADACAASKPFFWCKVLFKLVRQLRPTIAVELGTCLGISAAYQAAAAQLNGQGRVITMEGSAYRAALSRKHLESLGLSNATVVTGIFEDTLDSALSKNSPIDYAYIDAHHDEEATIKYFQQFLPYLTDECVLIFDDIAWSAGMRRAWQTVQAHSSIALSIDLISMGVCVVKTTGIPKRYRLKVRMPT